jgi:hypothetical protein
MDVPDWVEEEIRQQQRLLKELTRGMSSEQVSKLDRQMARLSDELRLRGSDPRRRRTDEVLRFWQTIDENLGNDLFMMDMSSLGAYMQALPDFAKMLKIRDVLWKRKVILEYTEYWDLYSENGYSKTPPSACCGATRSPASLEWRCQSTKSVRISCSIRWPGPQRSTWRSWPCHR